FNHYLEATKKRNRFDKFRMPLHFITGSIDPITKGYKRKHKRWHLFAETVDMSIIKDHGHYLLRDAPEELAGILVNITNNNRKTVNIEHEYEYK
ncbi:alpha/beta hydrolase, partial [[Flexibacter] sp. ATCC 35103]|uniref:alpha/beta hydrolase n=1 Tax=[Flexibacter] sp. ATCC 35103 TaxID=1937528 RepID=UPI0009C82718